MQGIFAASKRYLDAAVRCWEYQMGADAEARWDVVWMEEEESSARKSRCVKVKLKLVAVA
jgi:hypothetical protein